MESKEDLYEKAQQRLTEYLQAHKMRKTPERYEILRTVYQMNGIFSIDQVAEQMQQNAQFCVSRSTLFNTLETLVDAKLVIKHNLVRAALFECNAKPQPRVCLVCEHCGMVRRLEKAQVTEFLSEIKVRAFFVHQPVLYLQGACIKCSMAIRRKEMEKAKKEKEKEREKERKRKEREKEKEREKKEKEKKKKEKTKS